MSDFLKKPLTQTAFICLSIGLLYFLVKWPVLPVFAIGVFILSILSKAFNRIFLTGFQTVMAFVGKLKTILFMGIVYYLVLFPLSIFYRIFKKKKHAKNSRFIHRDHTFTAEDMKQMW